jgi:N-dimethylarginine dimethylaminohydrolase
MVGRGLRTNDEGAWQVAAALDELGVEVVEAQLPFGTMHLMGQLRFLDRHLAVGWPTRLSVVAVDTLRDLGYEVIFLPDEDEALHSFALNFVTVGPSEIVMPAGNPVTQAFYEDAGVTCHTVEISELGKAAGSIGCATGVVEREMEEMAS